MSTPQVALPSEMKKKANVTAYNILFAIGLVHLLNDSIQSVIPAIFPILRDSMSLSYIQLGLIAFTINVTASLLQPLIGLYTDSRPSPYLLPIGMSFTLLGMVGLAFSPNYYFILGSVFFVGIGSAVFHPEGSRVAYMAAGGAKRGLAQSIFQVGGNFGHMLAPILTILIFVQLGQIGAIYFTILAAIAIAVLFFIARWSQRYIQNNPVVRKPKAAAKKLGLAERAKSKQLKFALAILIILMFSKTWYGAGIGNYYPFYLIEVFGQTIKTSQLYIFAYLAAGVVGTYIGGPCSDRFGRRSVIWFSILGAVPFALLLPFANLFWAIFLIAIIGFIMSTGFSVIVVYAQEMFPGKVGAVSGLFFGVAFGLGGLGSIGLGGLADVIGIGMVMKIIGFLPLLGLLTLLLPSDRKIKEWSEQPS